MDSPSTSQSPAQAHAQMRVAIVGTGMAGLVSGYLLAHDVHQRYAVTLFEKGDRMSLDSASVSLRGDDGTAERVDMPMRAIAGGYYQNTRKMYDYLGIRYRPQRFLFAFSRQEDAEADGAPLAKPYFIHASNLHQLPPRPAGVSRISHTCTIALVLLCYVWLSACCFLVEPRADESFGDYLQRIRVPGYFVSAFVLPLMSSVATCGHKELLRFPATDLTEYKRQSHGSEHYVVSNGVRDVQAKLSAHTTPRLSTQVLRVEPRGSRVRLWWKPTGGEDSTVMEEEFDRVVLGVSPDIVGRIFQPLHSAMSRIPTITVESMVLQRPGPQGALSVVVEERGGDGARAAGGRQRQTGPTQLISLNSTGGPDPQTESLHLVDCGAIAATCPFSVGNGPDLLHRTAFPRVLRTVESRAIVNQIVDGRAVEGQGSPRGTKWTNGTGNVWLTGGWCWDGMVLLEGCVTSAMRVAEAFEVDIPWARKVKSI